MNRNLLSPIAGLIVAVLITVLASSALAGPRNPLLKCGQDPCPFGLSGQTLELNFGGSRIRCHAVAGRGRFGRLGSLAVLNLAGCRERVTVFNFRCSSSAAQVGPVRTSPMGAELKWGSERIPKLVFLGFRATFRCAQAMKFYVEGFFVGHLDPTDCNTSRSAFPIEPVLFAHGGIGHEPAFDIFVDANVETYKVPTPWQVTFRHNVTFKC